MKSIIAVLMTLALCIFTVGCSTTSTLVTTLDAVSDAASVAVVVTQGLVATGSVDQTTANEVASYCTAVSTAVNESITELNSTDTNAVKIDLIVADFTQVATPAFGSDASQVSAAISAVSSAIQLFLNELHSTNVLLAAQTHPTAPLSLAMNRADRSTLKRIQAKTARTLAVAQKIAVPVI